MHYFVKVKQGHPTGVRHRSGLTFTEDETLVSEQQMTDEMFKDSWLQVRVVGAPLIPSGTKLNAGDKPLSDEERSRLQNFADKLHAEAIAESDAASAASEAGREEKADGVSEQTAPGAEATADESATRRGRRK